MREIFQLLKEQGYQFGQPRLPDRESTCRRRRSRVQISRRRPRRRRSPGDGRHMVMYDRTDKVLEIDRHSVLAIAGVPATAYEMVRILEHRSSTTGGLSFRS
jgi:proteasome beta subunit